MLEKNSLNQTLGRTIENWQQRPTPPRQILRGKYCTVEPLNIDQHVENLFEALTFDGNEESWIYLPYGPFANTTEYRVWLQALPLTEPDTQLYVIMTNNHQPIGIAGYLRINEKHGVIEIGHLNFSNQLKKTPAATEAMYLMMRHVFDDLGYRRYEWKCNSLNEGSKKAALRYGFQYEGTFRQCNIFKNRNRDTLWFSIINEEWAILKARFERWLDPTNFNAAGDQIKRLADCI